MHNTAMQPMTIFELSVRSDHLWKTDPSARDGHLEKIREDQSQSMEGIWQLESPLDQEWIHQEATVPGEGWCGLTGGSSWENTRVGGEELEKVLGPGCPGPRERENPGYQQSLLCSTTFSVSYYFLFYLQNICVIKICKDKGCGGTWH